MELKEVNRAFSTYIRPQTFPMAIRMCQTGELPERTRLPQRDLGIEVVLCQVMTMGSPLRLGHCPGY